MYTERDGNPHAPFFAHQKFIFPLPRARRRYAAAPCAGPSRVRGSAGPPGWVPLAPYGFARPATGGCAKNKARRRAVTQASAKLSLKQLPQSPHTIPLHKNHSACVGALHKLTAELYLSATTPPQIKKRCRPYRIICTALLVVC